MLRAFDRRAVTKISNESSADVFHDMLLCFEL